MSPRFLIKLAIVIPLLILLLALDSIAALQGLPLLLIALGLALLLTDRLRLWLQAHKRATLAMLPFMTAALVLLFAFCRGRNLSQGILLLVTIAIVFDILLVALAAIAEASKRRTRGFLEFLGLAGLGLLLGLVLSLVFLIETARLGSISLAEP